MTSLDPDLDQEYEHVRTIIATGWPVKLYF